MIYCGLNKDGNVFGLHLSRNERDEFRLGVDRMMSGLIVPILFHYQFDFEAVPVLDPNTMAVIPDLYVIGM